MALYEPKYRSTVYLEPLLFPPSHEAINRPHQSPSCFKLTLPNQKIAPQYSNPSSPVSHLQPQNYCNLHNFVFFGQRPRPQICLFGSSRGRSAVEHRGTFIPPFVCSFPPQALNQASGFKSGFSSLKSGLSGLKLSLSGQKSSLTGPYQASQALNQASQALK